jgi:hypothetical protein
MAARSIRRVSLRVEVPSVALQSERIWDPFWMSSIMLVLIGPQVDGWASNILILAFHARSCYGIKRYKPYI